MSDSTENIPNRFWSAWSYTQYASNTAIENVPKLGDELFKPSYANTVIGFLPFVGNLVNFGSAIHAYLHNNPTYGHQKMVDTIVGTALDASMMGSTLEGLKLTKAGVSAASPALATVGTKILIQDVAQRTVARIGAFNYTRYIMNAPVEKYE